MTVFGGSGLILLTVLLLAACTPPHASSPVSPSPEEHIAQSAPLDSSANWKIDRDESELDHKVKITISDHDVILRCAPKFEGYIIPYIPSLGNRLDGEDGHGQYVRYRIDEGPIRKERWSISDDYTALFLSTSALRSALKGKKLVVEFKPDYVSRQTQTFSLDGLHEAGRKAGCKI
jgi:hypothetical protein